MSGRIVSPLAPLYKGVKSTLDSCFNGFAGENIGVDNCSVIAGVSFVQKIGMTQALTPLLYSWTTIGKKLKQEDRLAISKIHYFKSILANCRVDISIFIL